MCFYPVHFQRGHPASGPHFHPWQPPSTHKQRLPVQVWSSPRLLFYAEWNPVPAFPFSVRIFQCDFLQPEWVCGPCKTKGTAGTGFPYFFPETGCFHQSAGQLNIPLPDHLQVLDYCKANNTPRRTSFVVATNIDVESLVFRKKTFIAQMPFSGKKSFITGFL
jgi:hypothetical protein